MDIFTSTETIVDSDSASYSVVFYIQFWLMSKQLL